MALITLNISFCLIIFNAHSNENFFASAVVTFIHSFSGVSFILHCRHSHHHFISYFCLKAKQFAFGFFLIVSCVFSCSLSSYNIIFFKSFFRRQSYHQLFTSHFALQWEARIKRLFIIARLAGSFFTRWLESTCSLVIISFRFLHLLLFFTHFSFIVDFSLVYVCALIVLWFIFLLLFLRFVLRQKI